METKSHQGSLLLKLLKFTERLKRSSGSWNKDEKPRGSEYIPYVMDISENIITSATSTKPKTLLGVHGNEPDQKNIGNRQYIVYAISCKRGRSYLD